MPVGIPSYTTMLGGEVQLLKISDNLAQYRNRDAGKKGIKVVLQKHGVLSHFSTKLEMKTSHDSVQMVRKNLQGRISKTNTLKFISIHFITLFYKTSQECRSILSRWHETRRETLLILFMQRGKEGSHILLY
jgi:hypothetical protein